jgi:hypothetical protein
MRMRSSEWRCYFVFCKIYWKKHHARESAAVSDVFSHREARCYIKWLMSFCALSGARMALRWKIYRY